MKTYARIDVFFEEFFWGMLGNVLDIHTSFSRINNDVAARLAVEENGHVEFLNFCWAWIVNILCDEHLIHFFAFAIGLKRCEVAPEDASYFFFNLIDAFGKDNTVLSVEAVRADWQQRFAVEGVLNTYHSTGCEHCSQTGYSGRAGIHELMSISRDLRRLIQTGSRAEELQHQAMLEGMRTLRQDGIEKVLSGITSLDEVRATSNV